MRLRDGLLDDNKTVQDWQFLLKNIVSPQNLADFNDAMRLFPDNASCHEFNKQKLIELNNPLTKLVALNRPARAKNESFMSE